MSTNPQPLPSAPRKRLGVRKPALVVLPIIMALVVGIGSFCVIRYRDTCHYDPVTDVSVIHERYERFNLIGGGDGYFSTRALRPPL